MKRHQLLTLSLLVGVLLVPLAASADNHEMAPNPITWISYLQSQVGKSNALTQHLAEDGAKIYDGLMADGHVLDWGVAMPVNHFADDDWNVTEWVTFRDWAAMDAFMGAFMGMQMAKSPEQMMAEQEKWLSLVVPGSHYDEIFEHLVVAPGEAPPAYLDLSFFPVKLGQSGAIKKLWVENAKPTLDELQAAGTVRGFGMAVSKIHAANTPASIMFWTALPGLGSLDAMEVAMDAADKARGEEAQKALMEAFMSKVDLAGHSDRILIVTHNGGGGGGGEGGGE
jgi:hypothetical protein